jgi:putative membrane protein
VSIDKEIHQMRIHTLASAAALALTVAACGGGNGAADNQLATEANMASDPALNAALGGEPAPANQMAATPTDAASFAAAVAASDLFEIESGRLAQNKGTTAEVKTFGSQLVADHTKSTADLKTAAAKASPAVTVTPALDAEKQGMMAQLQAASGAEFDRLFVQLQGTAHRKTLATLQAYASGGDQQPLKDFATTASKVVEQHIAHVGGMQK